MASRVERVGAVDDQVVEVDQAAPALLALVAAEDRRDLDRGTWRSAPRGPDGLLVAVGGDEPRLRPFDLGGDLGRGQPGLAPPPDADQRDEEAHLAVEEGGSAAMCVGGATAELREGDCVERARRDRVVHSRARQSSAQLARGLARERDAST